MKKFLLTAAALALLTTAAHADDASVARGIATFIAYDLKCEKVPLAFKSAMDEALETVSTSAFKAATETVLAFYQSAGPAAFCKANKPVIEKAIANRP